MMMRMRMMMMGFTVICHDIMMIMMIMMMMMIMTA